MSSNTQGIESASPNMHLGSSCPPIAAAHSDRLSQYVTFKGKSELLLEPHYTIPAVERRMDSLWKARWSEYVIESQLRRLGPQGDTNIKLADTPLQLYLLYNRLARARLEIDIYSEILSKHLPAVLDHQSMPLPADQFLRLVQQS